MNKLHAYLVAKNLRQSDFAALVQSTQATISRLVGGNVLPGLALAARIERATCGAVTASSWVDDAFIAEPDQLQCQNGITAIGDGVHGAPQAVQANGADSLTHSGGLEAVSRQVVA